MLDDKPAAEAGWGQEGNWWWEMCIGDGMSVGPLNVWNPNTYYSVIVYHMMMQ